MTDLESLAVAGIAAEQPFPESLDALSDIAVGTADSQSADCRRARRQRGGLHLDIGRFHILGVGGHH